jgi:hypothetical protein
MHSLPSLKMYSRMSSPALCPVLLERAQVRHRVCQLIRVIQNYLELVAIKLQSRKNEIVSQALDAKNMDFQHANG